MAINRTTTNGNEKPTDHSNTNEIAKIAGISSVEIEKNKNDVASLNSDLKLLSTLLGRPLSDKDIPKLTKQQQQQQQQTNDLSIKQTTPLTSTIRTTKAVTSSPPPNSVLAREVELLQKIIQKQQNDAIPAATATAANELATNNNDDDKVLASIDPADAYGKTNDALLATLLKQRGIGPAHNAIPLNIYSSTTPRPIIQAPSRSPRPLLDGTIYSIS